ncbi:hypothetical protein [Blastococcus sp. PRF04-17]|uniref:hypothetical protein n=1 Tax=Blastococcus sp. PRF04-17 TaxID=2933797 RepID=UPI001FF5C480|nr:hypothetical protein [Blastococcus sp. PRF04-17]UOX99813.1 hypothetical protein MVA48_12250 [Blastococcus sp. PRF04-17]
MTLADPDLERRLRDQRHRAAEVAPPPYDLAARTRARYRAERRQRIRLAAAAAAVVLAVVAVPTVASTLLDDGRGSPAGTPELFDLPTRGSLAGDEEWLAGMAAVDWEYDGSGPVPDEAVPSEVRPEDRRVAFAGDVPTGRVALVLGRARGVVFDMWFAGPVGASPDEMTRMALPGSVADVPLLGLWDRPSADEDGVLIVLAEPGGTLEIATGHVITDDGHFAWDWRAVPAEDGLSITTPELPGHGPVVARVGSGEPVHLSTSERTIGFEPSVLEVADPRGLRDGLERRHLDHAILALEQYFGLPASELDPTLLWAGPAADGLRVTSALIGVTLPSGATAALVIGYHPYTGAAGSSQVSTLNIAAPAPPGTNLLDRVIAVNGAEMDGDWIAVSAPRSGVVAELLLEDGTVVGTIPLENGAGSGSLPYGPPLPQHVRVLDADGAVVGKAPALPETAE